MINSFLLIFLGIMTGQFLYMCTLWLQHKRKEYAFYVIHYLILVYFLFGVSYTYFFPEEFIARNQSVFNLFGFHPLHIFNFYLYIKFAQHFLDAPRRYPFLNQQAIYLMRGVWVAFAITLIAWYFFENNSRPFVIIYMGIYICLKLWAIWILYIVYQQKTREAGYILYATIFLSGGLACIYTLIALVDAGVIGDTGWIFLPCIIGILGEIVHVNAGLNYKASLQRKGLIETQQQFISELERSRQLLQERENVRNELSLQLNKEVGLTLDGIGLFAEHSLNKFRLSGTNEIENILQRIVADSSRMVSSMSDIVWVLSPENDKIARTIQRLQSYATKLCREHQIALDFYNDFNLEKAKLDMKERGDLYNGFKQVLKGMVPLLDGLLSIQVRSVDATLVLIMEGRPKKEFNHRLPDMPPLDQPFEISQHNVDSDYYWRIEARFETHPAG